MCIHGTPRRLDQPLSVGGSCVVAPVGRGGTRARVHTHTIDNNLRECVHDANSFVVHEEYNQQSRRVDDGVIGSIQSLVPLSIFG